MATRKHKSHNEKHLKMITALSVLLGVVAISAVQINYVAPVASGYIYRSDNNGPASLIQLGEVPFQKPALAPPLPLAQPLKLEAIEAYDLEPRPLPYVVAKPIVIQDAEEDADDDDDSEESSDEYIDSGDLIGHGHAYEKGAGNAYNEEHHSAKGEKGSKAYKSKDHHAKGESGNYGNEHKEGFYNEEEDENKAHHNKADAHGKNHESVDNHKGENYGHKKHFGKGEEITGYHKIFHKDEFKKDHDFYDVADNSGQFKKHGYENKKHGSKKGGHKEGGHRDTAFEKADSSKANFHNKGHIDDSSVGHSTEEGKEAHFKHHKEFGKKGGSDHEKQYAYSNDDGEEVED